MGLIAASVLCAAADSLMPPGGVKRVGKLTCALVLLWGMLRPLAALKGIDLSGALEGYAAGLEVQTRTLEDRTLTTRKAVIEDHFAAYISDRAAALGLSCRVEVDCAAGEEGVFLPEAVRLWGEFDAVAQSRLTQLLEEELGVPVERQSYYLTKEEGA